MPVLQIAGGGFSIHQSGVTDSSLFVYSAADVMASHGPYPLLIVADAVDSLPEVQSLAEEIVRGMAVFLRHLSNEEPAVALERAFAIANERVLSANAGRSGMQRLYLGLTCVVVDGDELFVAQCAPSQALVWQDDTLYAMPGLSTWSDRDITNTFASMSFPLGFQRQAQPRISYSRCATGDVVAVVSWPLARLLHDSGAVTATTTSLEFQQLLAELRPETASRHYHGGIYRITGMSSESQRARRVAHPRMVSVEQHNSVDWREDHTSEWFFGSGTASDFDTLGAGTSNHDDFEQNAGLVSQQNDGSGETAYVDLRSKPERFTGSGSITSVEARRHPAQQTSSHYASARPAGNTRSPARKGQSVEIFAGLLLSLSAAVVGVWQVTKRDRPIHGPRDDGTLGLPHLQRWSDTYHPPRFDRVRRASPRFQIHGFLMAGAVVAAVILVAAIVYTQLLDRSDATNATIDERLQEIASVRAQVDVGSPSESSYESLSSAVAVLNELESSTSSEAMLERIQEEQIAVGTAISEMTSTEQLGNVQVMGSLPAVPEGTTAQLFTGGGRIFVLSGGLYELDQVSSNLVQLLGAGDTVGGEAVGPLLAGSWNEDRPVVVDSHNAYMQDPSDGQWHRVPLGVLSSEGYAGITAIAAFDRNLYYLLSESGQILRFDALDLSADPQDWASGSAREDLQRGADMLIDGSIHVVLEDGSVLTFFRSALEATIKPTVIPELAGVSALTSIADGSHFFMVDSISGRIIGMDRQGQLYRQFVPDEEINLLRGATDLAINESNGITYVVANQTLYAVRLTLP